MRALPTTSFTTTVANTVYVGTVGDFFRYVPGSALTPVSNYVVASSDGLGQWLRMGIPNQTFQAATFWAVDPANGNDENTGWGATQAAADLVPLKTIAEWRRRVTGAVFNSRVQIHALSDSTNLDDSRFYGFSVGASGTAEVVLYGTPIVLFTGTITTYVGMSAAANARWAVTDTAIPTSWTASGGVTTTAGSRWIRKTGGTTHAHLLKDLGSKACQIGTPFSHNEQPSGGTLVTTLDFTNGDAYEVVKLVRWPGLTSYSNRAYARLLCLDLTGGHTASSTGAQDQYTLCGFLSLASQATASVIVVDACVYTAGGVAGRDWRPRFISSVNGNLQFGMGFLDLNGVITTMVASEFRMWHSASGHVALLRSFDVTGNCLHLRHTSHADLDLGIAGTGNSGKLIVAEISSTASTNGSVGTTATSDPNPFSVNGVAAASPPGMDSQGSAIW
jgi:hypothetical protein